MITEAQFQEELQLIIKNAIREDIGPGDYSSLACIPAEAQGKAKLLVKDEGVIAGVEFAKMVFHYVDPRLKLETPRYALRGVSASKEDVHNAIKNIDKGLFPKAFCKIIPDYLTNDNDYCIIMHADGAGTKSSLAYMYWKETGDLSVWKGIAQDALIMNIDDLLCVGATDNILLSSTIGRNKNLIPAEVISAIINGTEELIAELKSYGVTIHSTGGETADVGDLVRTIIAHIVTGKQIGRAHV